MIFVKKNWMNDEGDMMSGNINQEEFSLIEVNILLTRFKKKNSL